MHDKLIGLVYKEIKDVRVISLIRKYLQAGVMENGVSFTIDLTKDFEVEDDLILDLEKTLIV